MPAIIFSSVRIRIRIRVSVTVSFTSMVILSDLHGLPAGLC